MATATAVPTSAEILATLKSKGKESTRAIYARHGMDAARVYGVSVADLKVIAKSIKGQQELACALYESNIMDAMYLAGMVADGARLTAAQLNEWVAAAEGLQTISEYTIPWLAVENAKGRELALKWMKSKKEHVAAAGWCTYGGLVAVRPDDALDLDEVEGLLGTVVREIHKAPNRVRHTMNLFVISVGGYVKPLNKAAKAAARAIGPVRVEMGETACKVPLATDYIAKMEAAGKLGKKRKTMRC
jgi:3-methyladenine DNA glycosylase AlkD